MSCRDLGGLASSPSGDTGFAAGGTCQQVREAARLELRQAAAEPGKPRGHTPVRSTASRKSSIRSEATLPERDEAGSPELEATPPIPTFVATRPLAPIDQSARPAVPAPLKAHGNAAHGVEGARALSKAQTPVSKVERVRRNAAASQIQAVWRGRWAREELFYDLMRARSKRARQEAQVRTPCKREPPAAVGFAAVPPSREPLCGAETRGGPHILRTCDPALAPQAAAAKAALNARFAGEAGRQQAAMVIQAAYRGHIAREELWYDMMLAAKRQAELERKRGALLTAQARAAMRLQSVWRGRLAREELWYDLMCGRRPKGARR